MNVKNMERIKAEMLKKAQDEIETSFQPLIEAAKKAKNVVEEVLTVQTENKQRLVETNQLILQNLERFKTADPGEIADISRQRVGLMEEAKKIEELLVDLEEKILPMRNADLKATKAAMTCAIRQFEHDRAVRLDEEVCEKDFHNSLEPKLKAIQETALAISDIYHLGLWKNDFPCRVRIYSPVFEEVCDMGHHGVSIATWVKLNPEPVIPVTKTPIEIAKVADRGSCTMDNGRSVIPEEEKYGVQYSIMPGGQTRI